VRDWVHDRDEEDPEDSIVAAISDTVFQVLLRGAIIVVQELLKFELTGHSQFIFLPDLLRCANDATQEALRMIEDVGHFPSFKDLAELSYLRAICGSRNGNMALAMILMDDIDDLELELNVGSRSRYDAERARIRQAQAQSSVQTQRDDLI